LQQTLGGLVTQRTRNAAPLIQGLQTMQYVKASNICLLMPYRRWAGW